MKKYLNALFLMVCVVFMSAIYSTLREQVFAQYPSQEPVQMRVPLEVPRWHVLSSENTTTNTVLITVVVPELKRICVYEQDRRGVIHLRSVRHINVDLQLDAYNLEDPLPEQIQEFLNQRQY